MQRKYKDDMPGVKREEWDIEKLSEESMNELPDETLRKSLRGDEEKGNPDNRDMVGNVSSNETPQGREEAKNDTRSKANRNG
jgi:hypothetical protein